MCCKLRLAILMATMIVPVTVMAENDELDSLDGPDSSVELVDKSEDPSTEILPEIGDEDQLAVFVLDRGLYFASEVGVFINLGGLNGNSNLQPFISTTLGIDIDEIFSGQFVVSQGYVSQNPLTEADLNPQTGTLDYSLTSFTLEAVAAARVSRFAAEVNLGAGLTRINPQLHASDFTRLAGWSPHVVGGVDFKYLTLLTDFSAGISLNAIYVLMQPSILGLSASGVLRYTF